MSTFQPTGSPEADEAMAKSLVELEGQGAAPDERSPAGRALREAAQRHRARELARATGKPVTIEVGAPDAPRHADDPSKVLPGAETLRAAIGDAGSPFAKAIEGQATTARALRSRRSNPDAVRAVVEQLEARFARRAEMDKLIKSVGLDPHPPVRIRVKRDK